MAKIYCSAELLREKSIILAEFERLKIEMAGTMITNPKAKEVGEMAKQMEKCARLEKEVEEVPKVFR